MMESTLVPYSSLSVIPAKKVVVLAPHPDDEVFGCAGAIAAHLKHGHKVDVVILTDGSRQGVAEKRSGESRQAADVLGYGEPVCWGIQDRALSCTPDLVQRLGAFIQSVGADLLYAPSPWEIHPDHRQASRLAAEAVLSLKTPCRLAFYEVGSPLRPNVFLDITEHSDLKSKAMSCFDSQQEFQNYREKILALNRYRTYTLPDPVHLAEAYLLLDQKELAAFAAHVKTVAWRESPGPHALDPDPALVSVMVRSTDRPFLSQALDSIAIQTWPHIEVVLVAATPGHSKPPASCGPHPVRFIETSVPLGRSAAANRALKEARGSYLMFLDDDDWLMPSHVSRLCAALDAQPHVSAAYAGVALTDSEGQPLGQTLDLPFDFVRQRAGNITPIHAVMFRSQCLGQGLKFNESLDLYEDWDFWLNLARLTPFSHLPGVSAVYRVHSSSGVHATPMSQNIEAQKIQQAWEDQPPVSRSMMMERVWAFNELEEKLLNAEQEIQKLNSESALLTTNFGKALNHLNETIDAKAAQVRDLESELAGLKSNNSPIKKSDTTEIEKILSSRSWRITRPLRDSMNVLRSVRSRLLSTRRRVRNAVASLYRLPSRLRLHGFRGLLSHATHKISREISYRDWIAENEPRAEDYGALKARMQAWSRQPLVSVLMPTYNTPLTYLRQAVQSVRDQLYPHWELCIADDASTQPHVRKFLREAAQQDDRIVLTLRSENGHISACSNTALESAKGEWIALLDHDDVLHPLALFRLVESLQLHPDANLVYSDEDKIDEGGLRFDPYFKPDFNRELMWAQNMVSHLGCYRRDVLLAIGGFRRGFEGSQDYDLALRVIERSRSDQIVHVPRVLYHWRAIEGSTARAAGEKPYAEVASRRALTEHLQRIGVPATVCPAPEIPSMNRVRPELPEDLPLVSILIPTRDRIELLRTCIETLLGLTTYPSIEVIVIDNGSEAPESLAYLDTLRSRGIQVLRDDGPFNYSAINNRAAQVARGEFICLMNNDIEIITPDWLQEMLSFAALPGVGAVGTRLWYPDNQGLQHGGVVIGLGGVAGHAHSKLARHQPGYFGRVALHHRLLAVTAACLLIRKSHFMAVNGMDENLAVAFNDVDFCLRLHRIGLACIYTPYAEMIHHESASRGDDLTGERRKRFESEVQFMQDRWKQLLGHDPFYSPNLSLLHGDFRRAERSRVDLPCS